MQITYLGPYDEIEIMASGQTCKRGESVEVSAEIAGRAPSGDPDEPDHDYDAGEGLLAQDVAWVVAGDEGAAATRRAAAAEKRAERKAAKDAAEAAASDAANSEGEGE